MKAFLKHLWLQLKMDVREKGTLLVYYLLPLVFYFVVGAVFASVNPLSKQTLSFTMVIFAVTMGSILGIPAPIVKMRESEVLRAYHVCGVPGWAVLLVQAVSAFLHLLIVSLVILITAPLIYGADVPQSYPAYLAVLFIFMFNGISIGLLIGVSAKNQSTAMLLSQAVFLPTVMLAGIMFPASMLPEALQIVGYAIPATFAVQSFSGLAFSLPVEINAVLSLLITAGTGIICVILTAIRFRKISKA